MVYPKSKHHLLKPPSSHVTGYRSSRHTTRNKKPRIPWQSSPFQPLLFVSSSKSLDPNRADPSLKLAMENPKWTEEKTNICMSEYPMYIT
ncbi:hypothetical protein Bca4012_062304 [Brassica carinata]